LTLRGWMLYRMMSKGLDSTPVDEVIVVDVLSLYWASRKKVDCHFVSLEVDDYLPLMKRLDISKIKSVVTQTRERYDRLFAGLDIRCFFVQNAPKFVHPKKRSTASANLIYNGSAWAPFGALDLIGFVKAYPGYKLHFKGNVHREVLKIAESECGELVRSGSLTFSDTYIGENALREYLSDYSIGFCLYDFNNPDIAKRRFNYETAPSGKVYMYLSVGLPVIATNIRGFKFIEDARAGVLLNDHRPESLKNAVDLILNDYKTFSDNALMTGQKFSFDKAAKTFIDFVTNG